MPTRGEGRAVLAGVALVLAAATAVAFNRLDVH